MPFAYSVHKSALLLLSLSASFYALDQITKWAARHAIAVGERITVIPEFFFLVHAQNTGAPFGMLSGNNSFFIGLSVVALAALGYFWKRGAFRTRSQAFGAAFLIAGILGNLTSRLVDGYVTDFLMFDLHLPFASPWPAFNIADCCICIAAFLFIMHSIFDRRTIGKIARV
jgi:signal peptidase II